MAKKKSATAPTPGPYQPLLDALRDLKAQGADGFEGFFRDALQSIAGRTFRLVKSGPQGGKDIVVDNKVLMPGIALEGKRFGKKTSLPQDELISKLRDAIATDDQLDVWGVILSREMQEPDWSALEQIGHEAGVALLCLDWRDAPGTLPSLAALCAAVPYIAIPRLANVQSTLYAVRAHPEYSSAIATIKKTLTAPDTGFDLASRAAADWLRMVLASEAQSSQLLRSRADVLAPASPPVERAEPSSQLDSWWNSGGGRPAVLLGDEGRGKTWCAAQWCAKRFNDAELPMVLAVSSKDIGSYDPAEILTSALSRAMPSVDSDVLQRRIRRWASAPECRVLLVVDGLNERWELDWGEFVRQFDVAPWKGSVSLLLTSRRSYWREEVSSVKDRTSEPNAEPPKVTEINVTEFGDEELDAFLAQHNSSRIGLPSRLVDLIRIPRFGELAIRLTDHLKDTEDLTVARLVLEDWRSRIDQRGSSLRVGEEELLSFVSRLGKDALADRGFRISRSEIHRQLSIDSGDPIEKYYAAINEITEGHWLEATATPYKYKVSERLLPFAIALDLLAEIGPLADTVAIQEKIDTYVQQLGGSNMGLAILRAAAAAAFLQGNSSQETKRILLERWIKHQNFGSADFAELCPLVKHDAVLFVDVAEEFFTKFPVHRGEGEILAKGLAVASKWPAVLDELVRRLPHWTGAYRFERFPGHNPAIVRPDPGWGERAQARLAEWRTAGQGYHLQIERYLYEEETETRAHAALSIISLCPRAPFIETLVTFAVAKSIMGNTLSDSEPFAWLLRHNDLDHAAAEEAILKEVGALRNADKPVAHAAADYLIDTLATMRASKERSVSPAGSTVRPTPDWPELDADKRVVWSGKTQKLSALRLAERLAAFAPDPLVVLDAEDAAAVADAVQSLSRKAMTVKGYLSNQQSVMSAFARWSPQSLASFVRGLYQDLPQRDADERVFIVRQVDRSYLLLGDEDCAAILEAGRAGLAQLSSVSEATDARRVCQDMIAVGISKLPVGEQIDALRGMMPDLSFSVDLMYFLENPPAVELDRIFGWLRTESDTQIIRSWLGYIEYSYVQDLPPSAEVLLDLAKHEDVAVRNTAIAILYASKDETFGRRFVESGWCHQKGQERREAICGTCLLCEHGGTFPFDEIRSRIMPEGLPYLAYTRGSGDAEIRAVFDYLTARLEEFTAAKKSGISFYGHGFSVGDVWNKVAELDDGVIAKKLRSAILSSPFLGMFNAVPVHDLLRAILDFNPDEGVDVWRAFDGAHAAGRHQDGRLRELPFLVPANEHTDTLRFDVIQRARTDSELAEAVYLSLLSGHEGWLLGVIRTQLAQENAGSVARGLILAGYLDTDEAADKLWSEINVLSLSPWLVRVRDSARSCYRRNRYARHWFDKFLSAKNADEAYASYILFESCIDDRAGLWGRRALKDRKPDVLGPCLLHLDATVSSRRERLKKLRSERAKTLYHGRSISYLSPWF
jgi:hypothetical protein